MTAASDAQEGSTQEGRARVGRARETEFEPVYHHYGPHRAGLPALIPYFRELWRRRAFAAEMSRATMRGANTSTFFGQAADPQPSTARRCVLHPGDDHSPRERSGLLRPSHPGDIRIPARGALDHQRRDLGDELRQATAEYALSRLLIPLSAVRTAFFRFLPTVPVYFVFHAIFLTHVWSPKMLLALYFLATMIVFAMGLAAFFAALQVYFRDTSSFLPFFVRIWMYLSPDLVGTRTRHWPILGPIMTLIQLNPMYSMIGGYTELLQNDAFPTPTCGYPLRCGQSRLW